MVFARVERRSVMVDAIGATSLLALKARMVGLSAATAEADPSSVVTSANTAPIPPSPATKHSTSASATPSYPRGSVESENAQMATGMAKAARTNIETLNIGVSSYNGATRLLADKNYVEDLRARGGDKVVDLFIRSHQQIQRGAMMLMNGASGKMAQEFTITGTPLSKADDGSFKVGDYVQSTGGEGWSVSVKSDGKALAIANGVDVSAQVDDSSSSGFKWSALGQSVNIEA
jgi:hypothetical protein